MGTNQFAKLLKYYLNLNGKTQSDMVHWVMTNLLYPAGALEQECLNSIRL